MRSNNLFYQKKELVKTFLLLVAGIFLCKVTLGFSYAIFVFLLLIFLVMRKTEGTMNILFFATVSMGLGRYFIPFTVAMLVSQKLVLTIAAFFLVLKVFGRHQSRVITPLWSLVPYLVYIVIVSQVGWCPVISNLKWLLFVMVFFALYGGAVNVMVDRSDVRKLRVMLLSLSTFVLLGSILSIPFPAISQMTTEEYLLNPDAVSLFRGVTCHSQSLGPYVAMFSTFLFGDLLFNLQKRDNLYLLLLLTGPFLIYKTSSRTAMASYAAGMLFVAYLAMRSRMVNRRLRSKIMFHTVVGISMAGLFVLAVPTIREKIVRFVVKNYSGDNTFESANILSSRQNKLDLAIENWRRSPFIGNGFQVSEDMKYIQIRGIRDMLSAPVEKSTWIYAILEEGGIFGMALFLLFIIVSLGLLIKNHAYIGASLLFEMLMINMGEFGIFSPSSIGGAFWCMVFFALVFDYKRNQSQMVRPAYYRPVGMGMP